eukprot:TRINITY_DN25428_c0_g1_i1.p2 TRINITY_DN25428_c0_g1~~TRINITY_DN25428_c0_g1_i1.p2  ORF type:complete len:109 (+),score=2.86 TRINITY_DN25428_c0_g1_i1:3-329(+)
MSSCFLFPLTDGVAFHDPALAQCLQRNQNMPQQQHAQIAKFILRKEKGPSKAEQCLGKRLGKFLRLFLTPSYALRRIHSREIKGTKSNSFFGRSRYFPSVTLTFVRIL